MTRNQTIISALVAIVGLASFTPVTSAEPLKLLFLGDERRLKLLNRQRRRPNAS